MFALNPAPRRPLRALLGLATAFLLGACTTVESSQWNLHQLHNIDGSTRRVGELRNGIQHALSEFIDASDFKVPFIDRVTSRKAVPDPLGRCLHNLNGFLGEENPNVLLLGEQVSMLTWLSEGCDYALSRERCALTLGNLAAHFDARGPHRSADPNAPGVVPDAATPEVIGELIAEFVQAAVPQLLKQPLRPDSTKDLATLCEEARRLRLDRNGARRMLVTCSALSRRLRPGQAGHEALEDLRLALGKQCVEFALLSAINDPNPRVRAAGLGAWIQMTAGQDPEPFALGLASGAVENVQVAIAGFERYGIPDIPQGSPSSQSSGDSQAAEKYWAGVLVQLLDQLREGPAALALCHGMSQLTGLPENLRPEHWIALQLEREAQLQAGPLTP